MKKIFFIMLLLLLVPTVSANNLLSGLVAYYNFDANANDIHTYKYNGSVTGADLDTNIYRNGAGSYYFNGADYITANSIVTVKNGLFADNFTICAWVNLTSKSGNHVSFSIGKDDNNYYQMTFLDASPDLMKDNAYDGGASNDAQLAWYNTNNWHFICTVRDTNGLLIGFYVNGTATGTVTASDSVDFSDFTQFIIGALYYSSSYVSNWDGNIDEVMLWNRTITHTDISNIYNQSWFYSDFTLGYDINITVLEPINATGSNENPLEFIYSVNAVPDNCNLYSDINGSFEIVNNTFTVDGKNCTMKHTLPPNTEDNITYYIECIKGITYENSSLILIYYDSINPNLNINTPASNNTIVGYGYLINISCEDNNLLDFETEIRKDNITGIIINQDNILNTSNTYEEFNMIFNNSLGTAVYYGIVNCSDGHTANKNKVDDMNVLLSGNKINYEYDGVILTEKIITAYKNLYSVRKSDRYTSILEFDEDKINYAKKEYSCSVPFRTVRTSETEFHKVCGMMWIDEISDEAIEIIVTKDNSKKYSLDIYLDGLFLKTKSVGIINTEYKQFNISLDGTATVINLLLNNSINFSANENSALTYFAKDNTAVDNCTLYLNNTYNQIDYSITNNATNEFIVNIANTGYIMLFNYTISCYDIFGNYNISETRNFYIIPIVTEAITSGFIFTPDLTTLEGGFILFILIFAYIGVMIIGFWFKNFGFLSLGFFIGLFIGFIISVFHIFLTFVFIFINIGILFTSLKSRKE